MCPCCLVWCCFFNVMLVCCLVILNIIFKQMKASLWVLGMSQMYWFYVLYYSFSESKSKSWTCCFSSPFRTIPPEQQAEADELVAALSELQATTAHEYQDVVGGDVAVSHKKLFLCVCVVNVYISFSECQKWQHRRVENQDCREDSETGTWHGVNIWYQPLWSKVCCRPLQKHQWKWHTAASHQKRLKIKSSLISPKSFHSQLRSFFKKIFFFLKLKLVMGDGKSHDWSSVSSWLYNTSMMDPHTLIHKTNKYLIYILFLLVFWTISATYRLSWIPNIHIMVVASGSCFLMTNYIKYF